MIRNQLLEGNTVGSLEVPITLRARKNLVLRVNVRQCEILIGCVLGDATIRHKGQIRIEQSTAQKDYVLWKYEELKSLAYPASPREIVREYKKRNKQYASIYFVLRQYFRPWRTIFYSERKKMFPERLRLTPLSLAVWYMDDGCWTGEKVIISTDCFDSLSMQRIQNALLKQFGIETVTGKNRKLTIRKNSHNKFLEVILPHIIPSMRYKLPDPVTTFPIRRRRSREELGK